VRVILFVHMDDVAQDVGDVIDKADMSPDRNVPMIRRRRRQLARQVTRNRMRALAEVRIQRPARLEARFLIRRQSVLRSEAGRRFALMVLIPIIRCLTGMIVELPRTVVGSSARIRSPILSADRRRRRDKSQHQDGHAS
jgi:hypothetical protein